METRISKSGKASYREKLYINGRAILSPVFKRKSDATTWKQRMVSERDRSAALGISANREINFCDFLQLWNERKFASLAISTKERYLSLQKLHLTPFFGRRMLREINKELIHDFGSNLRLKDAPPQTMDLAIRLLKTMLACAVDWDYLRVNPVCKFPQYTKRVAREEYWDEQEAVKFLESTKNQELYPLYFLAIKLGLRRGELAGLKWDVVNFAQNHISICRTRDRYGLHEVTKTLLKRDIPMNSEVRAMMKALLESKRSDFVFTNEHGKPVDIQHAYRAFGKAQGMAGMTRKIRFHDLRHTFASIFLMRNGNLNALAKIMGHSQTSMTQRYGHIAHNHIRNEMEKMDWRPVGLETSPHLAHKSTS